MEKVDPKKLPLRLRIRARQLARERLDRKAAERGAVKEESLVSMAAKEALVGRWYIRTAEVGLVVPRARFIDGTPIRLYVPIPEHVASSISKLLGGPAENDDRF